MAINSFHFVEEFLLNLFILSIVFGLAIPKSDSNAKKRVLDPLAEDQHYVNSEHNREYDHKAFLGEEADDFDELSPEESKRRLALIVDKIDSNSDGFVSLDELKQWIHISQKKYIFDDVDRQWKSQTNDDETIDRISWEDYKKNSFGFLSSEDSDESKTYKEMLRLCPISDNTK